MITTNTNFEFEKQLVKMQYPPELVKLCIEVRSKYIDSRKFVTILKLIHHSVSPPPETP